MWQLFIKGLEGKTYTINITTPNPERTTVVQLKRMVEAKTGIEVEYQRLIYTSKNMDDDKTLADYEALRNGSNIFLVMRLPGGSVRQIDASLPRSSENCMIMMENTEENGIVVLKMPCGHSISPDGLMDYAWAEVSTNMKSEIKCPLCATVWEFSVIKKYGGATATELDQLEMGISKNFCTQSSDINECPKCQSYCMRQNTDLSSLMCLVCSRKTGTNWYFCWHCLRDWKKPLSSSTCGNPNCNDAEKLAQLRDCGKVRVDFLKTSIFKLRACPKCGTIIELASGCKHMTCKVCHVDFCFVCLRRKTQGGSWSCGSYNTKCAEAPRQTIIPRL